MRPCPVCAEEIQESALKCRYCNEWIAKRPADVNQVAAGGSWASSGSSSTPSSSLVGAPPAPSSESAPSPASPATGPLRTEGLAVASLVAGIGVLLMGALAGIPALVMGVLARKRIDASSGTRTGRGMATTGIVLGGLSILLTVAALGFLMSGRGPAKAGGTSSASADGAMQADCHALGRFADRLDAGETRTGRKGPAFTAAPSSG